MTGHGPTKLVVAASCVVAAVATPVARSAEASKRVTSSKELFNVKDWIDFDEKPAHHVTITQPFLMGVTVGQSRQFDTDVTLAWIKALPPKA